MTVITAARDAAGTLPDTLASVRAQTFTDWEHVVVDDGSADATGRLAAEAGARVLRHVSARGPAASRNHGAREARGELIATLDADDLWKPDFLERQVALLDERRVALVCCDADLMDRDGRPTGERWTDRVGVPGEVTLDAMLRENVVFTSVVCSRAAFLALGGYDEDPRLGVEDYDLWLRLLEAGHEIAFNPASLAFYRLGGEAMSSKVEAMAAGSQLMLGRALERGRLTAGQRRIARRRRRVFGVVERRARIAAAPTRAARLREAALAAPLVAVSVLENPERWRHWLTRGPRSAGASRHTGGP